MDKYRQLRETVAKASAEIIGKTVEEAKTICEENQLSCRWVAVDGRGCLITADCRMDRIGFIIKEGIVIDTRNG